MSMNRPISAGLIVRDKFSTGPLAAAALADELPQGSELVLVDPGYPEELLEKIESVATGRGLNLRRVPSALSDSTNRSWNLFVEASSRPTLLAVENDVTLQPGGIHRLLAALDCGEFDIVVPVIYENNAATIHFDPPISRIEELPDGTRRSGLVRRPKPGYSRVAEVRRISHLEKHCFAMARRTADLLGPIDENMHCRTDIDLSLLCHVVGVRIGIVPEAGAVLHTALAVDVDEAAFRARWDLDAARRANARLVAKWNLVDYQSSVPFVLEMEERLRAHRGRKPLAEDRDGR